MTVISPPAFIAGSCYEAQSFRHLLNAASNGTPGILQGLGVTLISGRNITFDTGSVVVPGAAFAEGYYQVVVSAAETVTIAVGSTLPRIDLVVARVKTTEFGDVSSTGTVEVVQGTPNATPVAPTPAFGRYFVLATVNVVASMSSLTSTDVIPSRVRAGTSAVPTGSILMFGGAAAPSGYLLCDGATVSSTTYPALAAALGVVGATFVLPDLRGRSPIGAGTGTGLTTRTLLSSGGVENVTLTTAQIPAHSHPVTGGFVTGGTSAYIPTTGTVVGIANQANTGNTGGGGSHTNMQPWFAVNFIIRSS